MIEQLYTKVSNIKKADSDEKIRFELYSIVTTFLLSTEIFTKNSNIRDFLTSLNQFKNIKPYAYYSRTILLGQVLRIIKEETKGSNYNFALDIKNYLEETLNNNFSKSKSETDNKNGIEKKNNYNEDKKRKNYTDTLFDRFKRGE